MALGSATRRRKAFVPPALQITSMMDMFTIIVFFLLFSYSEKPDEFDLDGSLQLPSSSSTIDYENSITLFLSADQIKLDDQVIAELSNQSLIGFEANRPKDSQLYNNLLLRYQQYELQHAQQDEEVNSPHILLFSDKQVPFKVINQVIKTAGLAGFSNFQLAVMEQ